MKDCPYQYHLFFRFLFLFFFSFLFSFKTSRRVHRQLPSLFLKIDLFQLSLLRMGMKRKRKELKQWWIESVSRGLLCDATVMYCVLGQWLHKSQSPTSNQRAFRSVVFRVLGRLVLESHFAPWDECQRTVLALIWGSKAFLNIHFLNVLTLQKGDTINVVFKGDTFSHFEMVFGQVEVNGTHAFPKKLWRSGNQNAFYSKVEVSLGNNDLTNAIRCQWTPIQHI